MPPEASAIHQRLSPWANFAALSLLFFLVSAGTFSSLGVVLPAMVRELGWTWAEAGLGYTLLGLACGLASFVPAYLIRRIGVRGDILLGAAVLAGGFGALAIAHAVWTYLLGTVLTGLGFSLVGTVPGTHVLTSLFKRRSAVLGAYFTIGALGGVAGPLAYVAVQALTHGWRAYWIVFVVAAVLLGVFGTVVAPKGAEVEGAAAAPPEQVEPAMMIAGLHDWTVQRALATPQFYVIVGAYTTYLLVNTTAHGFGVEHLVERGVEHNTAAAMMSLEALIGAGVSSVGGVLGEKLSPRILLIVAMIALTIGMSALAEARDLPMMLIYALGLGIGFGLTFLASTVLLFNYFGKGPNLELYSIMCLMSTSAALGPAVGGWARDTFGGFTVLFLLCALSTLLMLAAALFLRPPGFARGLPPAMAAESAAE